MKKTILTLFALLLTIGIFSGCEKEDSLAGTTWANSIYASGLSPYGYLEYRAYMLFEDETTVIQGVGDYANGKQYNDFEPSRGFYKVNGNKVIVTMYTAENAVNTTYIRERNKMTLEFFDGRPSTVYIKQ